MIAQKHNNKHSKTTLATLPKELIMKLVDEYRCLELGLVNRRLRSIAIDSLLTHRLYSPKAPRDRSNTLSAVQSYLRFVQVVPNTIFGDSIESLFLNLNHFTGNVRFEECGEISELIKTLPALKSVKITLEKVNQEENLAKLVGSSKCAKELTIEINDIFDDVADVFAQCILKLYPSLEVLTIHRPADAPGLAQDNLIESMNRALPDIQKTSLKKIVILNDFGTSNEMKIKETHHYLHIYKLSDGAFHRYQHFWMHGPG
ncbi:hypothetical protein E3P92_01699 [Wallemia ichthyophaga]|uniref:F-box domain-containing protein n=1 Tax=Wallemia ichthyophaga TaxID=245174 RepID=A0A4T0ILF0_WALIC|nr:hypothetical protein E3P91_04165 [Wallemia ichthyophaga]TIA83302.1 hypothetical protein E3P98_00919 [Wallemia ichthyophaga]TIA86778.1 hypothetical protein E3P97_04135 [Wallemia ichthyophaga]TIA95049.1 hypothetical protein E3P96_03931 [Wallemia ichthyophaga]TIB15133.1 hypothetical protein E3P92_01699 [Wallemia ichthyophaga]